MRQTICDYCHKVIDDKSSYPDQLIVRECTGSELLHWDLHPLCLEKFVGPALSAIPLPFPIEQGIVHK